MLKVFADRGGTFTDVVAVTNNQEIIDRLATYPQRFLIVPSTTLGTFIEF